VQQAPFLLPLSLSLTTSNRQRATPPASPFASRPKPTIGALPSATNPEPPPLLHPLSVSSTLPSSPSSIDRPSSLLIIPQCCRGPLGITGDHRSPLATPECGRLSPPSRPPPHRRPRSGELRPHDPARHLPGTSPVVTDNTLSPTRHSRDAGMRAVFPGGPGRQAKAHAAFWPAARGRPPRRAGCISGRFAA
jgi:hypothetical protein